MFTWVRLRYHAVSKYWIKMLTFELFELIYCVNLLRTDYSQTNVLVCDGKMILKVMVEMKYLPLLPSSGSVQAW